MNVCIAYQESWLYGKKEIPEYFSGIIIKRPHMGLNMKTPSDIIDIMKSGYKILN